jgi:phosphoribosylformylglycinamidine synthase
MARLSASGEIRVGLVQFPGSNCDADCLDVFKRYLEVPLIPIWHQETKLPPVDAILLPGGFSYGDYLRGGALASHARIMPEVRQFAHKGGPILGICNGFQILTEMGLLPGALLGNQQGRFVCADVHLAVAEGASHYHQTLQGQLLRVPVAHGEGRYFLAPDDYQNLQDKGQILFQYATAQGECTPAANPNGSVANIAGVVSENGKILGMMPHPERAADQLVGGSADGLVLLKAFLATI